MAPHSVVGKPCLRHQQGFGYLLVMLIVVLIGLGLGGAGTLWRTESQRLKESQLLFIGEQYRNAIRSYYSAPGPAKQFPKSLNDLLLDTRQTKLTRHLRKLYPDPVTGKKEWGLIVDADGRGISGVYSLAPGEPLKQRGFALHQREFEEAKTYAAWQFIVTPVTPAPPPPPKNPPSSDAKPKA